MYIYTDDIEIDRKYISRMDVRYRLSSRVCLREFQHESL
jgi:hypothetical protein